MARPKETLEDKVDFILVEKLAELGLTDKEIGYILGYSKRTIDRWKENEDFANLLKRAKSKADSEVVKSLYKRALGFEFDEETYEEILIDGKPTKSVKVKTVKKYIVPDTTAQIFWLKNRQPERWRDKQEFEHSGEIRTITDTTNFNLKKRG